MTMTLPVGTGLPSISFCLVGPKLYDLVTPFT